MTLNIRVIAPDRTVWDANAEEVILPSSTGQLGICLLYTSPSPRDLSTSRMPSSA